MSNCCKQKRVAIVISLTVILIGTAFASCTSGYGRNGTTDATFDSIQYSGIQVDSFRIRADQTSLSGRWMMLGDALYFMDEYVVGVKKYNLDGRFLEECVRQGRARNEMISPVIAATTDRQEGRICFLDSNMAFSIYDPSFDKQFHTEMPFFYEFDPSFGDSGWKQLMSHPDPKSLQMYEYNLDSDRMISRSGRITLPEVIEHVHYNGYETGSRAREVWRNSFVFISFDYRNISGTAKLWGKYPPVYHKRNIPVFSAPDICETDEGFLVSFPADPKIYVYDLDGKVRDEYGLARKDISQDYPETRTVQEFERGFKKLRKQKGYYGRMFLDGQRLLRQYHTDGGTYGMQIYEGRRLAGDIPLAEPMEILGQKDGVYYAFVRTDLEEEEFVMIKFTLA